MVNQSLLTAEIDFVPGVARRVYCAEDAPLRLADGTPLHLEWVIEGGDGKLYTVRSEPGSWLRRTPYQGHLGRLKLVSSEKAETIIWLTYADTDGAENASVREHGEYEEQRGHKRQGGDGLGRWAY
jgi:hypothetical protein